MGCPRLPTSARQGPNAEVGRRSPAEAELYGMKIAQLLLPTDGHRVGALRRFKERYNTSAPFSDGENSTTSLGLVGGIGFLVLLGALFVGRRNSRASGDWFSSVAKLNLAASSARHCWRIGLAICLSGLPPDPFLLACRASSSGSFRCSRWWRCSIGSNSGFPARAAFALALRAGGRLVRPGDAAGRAAYADIRTAFDSDRDFVRTDRSRAFRRGSMVFQLPYVQFPEGPPVQNLDTNDPLRPYLHSRTLALEPTNHAWPQRRPVRAAAAAQARRTRSWPRSRRPALPGSWSIATATPTGSGDRSGAPSRARRPQPIVSADRRLAFFELGLPATPSAASG